LNFSNRKQREELLLHEKIFSKNYLNGKPKQMKPDISKYFLHIFILILVIWTLSCSGKPNKTKDSEAAPAEVLNEDVSMKLIKMVSPDENTGFKLNDAVKVVLAVEDKVRLPDSVMISFDGKPVKTIKSAPWEYNIPPAFTVTTGRKSLKVSAYREGKVQNTVTRFMIVYSDVAPKRNGYKVVHIYPHDKEAFTQGLFYDKGVFYEGTGQETSSLREVEVETGKVIRQLNLSSSLFGEGITLYRDLIFQVTWTSKVGFVYEKSTFKLIHKINYQTEGWGLTTIDDKIVMTDGTNIIYFYEPETFTVISRIEVYDNKQKVDSLNELEYINGEIWANRWMTDIIVRVDPASGKVLGYINLKNILDDPQTDTSVSVLNGIAYDKERNRIFVTGKNWPKLFEITITQ
jgi:glutamine cyclotransferase